MIDLLAWAMNQLGSFIGTMAAALIIFYILLPHLLHAMYKQVKQEILSDPDIKPLIEKAKQYLPKEENEKREIPKPTD